MHGRAPTTPSAMLDFLKTRFIARRTRGRPGSPRSRSPIHRVLHSTPEYPRKGPSASPGARAARAHRWACPTRGHRGRGCLLWPYRQCGAGPARRATRRSASGSSSTPSSTVGDRQLRLHSRRCPPMVFRRCSAALRSRRCRDRAGGRERGTRVLTAGGRAEAAARLDAALALGTARHGRRGPRRVDECVRRHRAADGAHGPPPATAASIICM
jgi:hypothetical protein